MLLPAIGAFVFWTRRQITGRIWLGSLFLNTVLYAAWPTWWLGLSFGHRGFELATFFAMIGLAWLIEASQGRPGARRVLQATLVAAIIWNLLLFGMFIPHKIPGEEAVTYLDMLKAFGNWIGLTVH